MEGYKTRNPGGSKPFDPQLSKQSNQPKPPGCSALRKAETKQTHRVDRTHRKATILFIFLPGRRTLGKRREAVKTPQANRIPEEAEPSRKRRFSNTELAYSC